LLPVVPKVRVGDVLYATRNLRNWLRTASLSVSVTQRDDGVRARKGIIYSPSKKDKYVVCINAGLVFSVFLPDRDMVLFFVNAVPQTRTSKSSSDPHLVFPSLEKLKKCWRTENRMSPAIFSTWFVRSSERIPDLRTWPDYAYAAWAALQMNASSLDGDYRLCIQIPKGHEHLFLPHMGTQSLGNFGSGERMRDRPTIRACIQHAIKYGMTRHRHQNSNFRAGRGEPSGPRVEDIKEFRKIVQDSLRNPRTRKRLEDEIEISDGDNLALLLDSIASKKDS